MVACNNEMIASVNHLRATNADPGSPRKLCVFDRFIGVWPSAGGPDATGGARFPGPRSGDAANGGPG